jgi:hypothetical protein|tara:strand:+ start:861 stop:1127 length:267 start_codon:yes stop_codon:yes gene_type:complete
MGRLTIKEVDDLKKAGILDSKAVKELEDKNLVGARARGIKYYFNNGEDKVYPQLYFKGLGKQSKPSKDMMNLRQEFNKLLNKYATKEQ